MVQAKSDVVTPSLKGLLKFLTINTYCSILEGEVLLIFYFLSGGLTGARLCEVDCSFNVIVANDDNDMQSTRYTCQCTQGPLLQVRTKL